MPSAEWAEYLRLVRSGVTTTVAATVVLEHHRRRRVTGPVRLPREHGTERGYHQHRADGTERCAPCVAAHTRHNARARRAA